jgi:hypothetical protein
MAIDGTYTVGKGASLSGSFLPWIAMLPCTTKDSNSDEFEL